MFEKTAKRTSKEIFLLITNTLQYGLSANEATDDTIKILNEKADCLYRPFIIKSKMGLARINTKATMIEYPKTIFLQP